MVAERAAPCRHAGAPPEAVVEKVARLITSLGASKEFLSAHGITADEYEAALSAAIESLRGSNSASNADRRRFLADLFQAMHDAGLITKLELPTYGDDTIYRLTVPNLGDVAVIQKGCPDGAHSSVRWSRPDWAREAYLWWLCSSLSVEPGDHVAKGVNRLRQRFFSEAPDWIDGVIFHNELCASSYRPCPKGSAAIDIKGRLVPPPCIYVTPDRDLSLTEWNWDGQTNRKFPSVLLALFGIPPQSVPTYVGSIGFQQRAGTLRTNICSRFGPARSTSFRK